MIMTLFGYILGNFTERTGISSKYLIIIQHFGFTDTFMHGYASDTTIDYDSKSRPPMVSPLVSDQIGLTFGWSLTRFHCRLLFTRFL